MTEEQAIEHVGIPALENASANWKVAWDEIRGQYNHPDFSNRIRSSLLQELAAIQGKKTFSQFGLKYLNDETQHMFIKPDKACIIYKKLDEHKRAQRNDTIRCEQLFQSNLFSGLPTLVIGMMPSEDFLTYVGIYMVHPNKNGIGNSWAVEITNRIVSVDVNQVRLLSIAPISLPEINQTKTAKFTPKNDPAEKTASAEGNDPSESV